ncbi:MAG: MTH1187 family thiamine-binding protein [Euryarchaeota archaeon]|nr:MTH1187 family thiamine-binding protein [Euryarchaeota archaeon]
MIIAELSVTPLGTGSTSVSEYVRAAIEALRREGVRAVPRAMATEIEAEDLDTLLSAVKAAHEAVLAEGAERVVTTLRIDHRLDRDATIESKLRSVGSYDE